MKSIKTILSHDKNVAKFLSSEFPVCIRDYQLVKHGLASYKLHSELPSLALHAFAPCKTWTASCKLHSELPSLALHAFAPCKTRTPACKHIRNSLRSLLMRLRIKTKKICLQASLQQIFFVLILVLQIILYCGALCVSGGACFEEVCFYHIGIGILGYPLHGFRLFLIARVKGSEA